MGVKCSSATQKPKISESDIIYQQIALLKIQAFEFKKIYDKSKHEEQINKVHVKKAIENGFSEIARENTIELAKSKIISLKYLNIRIKLDQTLNNLNNAYINNSLTNEMLNYSQFIVKALKMNKFEEATILLQKIEKCFEISGIVMDKNENGLEIEIELNEKDKCKEKDVDSLISNVETEYNLKIKDDFELKKNQLVK
jgi:hypothetical protein